MQGDVMCYLSESRYGWSDDDAMMREIQKLHRWKTTEWQQFEMQNPAQRLAGNW